MTKNKKKVQPLKIFILLAFLVPFVMFIVTSTIGRTEFNLPQKLTLELLGGVQSVFTSSAGFFKNVWEHYLDLVGVSKENDQLRNEVRKYRAMILEYREAAAANVRLTKLLELEQTFEQPMVTAQIIGRDPALWFKTLTISKGSSSGIEKGMPVVTVEGVVGQVINTSPNYAKVLLATDPNSAIDAIVQKNRVQGIIKGKGVGYKLHYVLKNNVVEKGDVIITSGMGGVFPKGLPIGEVSYVAVNRRGMFQEIEVDPTVDFRKLEYLSIILKKDPLAE